MVSGRAEWARAWPGAANGNMICDWRLLLLFVLRVDPLLELCGVCAKDTEGMRIASGGMYCRAATFVRAFSAQSFNLVAILYFVRNWIVSRFVAASQRAARRGDRPRA